MEAMDVDWGSGEEEDLDSEWSAEAEDYIVGRMGADSDESCSEACADQLEAMADPATDPPGDGPARLRERRCWAFNQQAGAVAGLPSPQCWARWRCCTCRRQGQARAPPPQARPPVLPAPAPPASHTSKKHL
ncbi:hypothetical protein HYH03_010416 [Edaphochlamys debaryana]|uniref:Uncharacterized protein n=1 Tax=Edaphochlamys debaryana TaxID=47281 RepID=A0A835XW00_9CHLO|nr:hypothetical protein HYH03_010416 [Edaphochlamys debaryana]|eukprot:KAG2491206.1 hypothetical protein HYH03_010416 [Edaphochlamys debaryana]